MNQEIFRNCIIPLRDKLYRFALRITGSAHEAEDVVQEVMENLWKSPESQSEQVRNWEAWSMTLTRNRSLDQNRRRKTRKTLPMENHERLAVPSVAAQTENSDLSEQIRRMMQELPEKHRLVMHLRDVEEMSYEEISTVLSMPADQVKINLHRARKTIRTRLIEELQISYP
ncbi:MAG: hypothetical protein RJA20_2381 [Bacteroidota bacterium]|jgi:RNA polymerase sigma-70 factor (ECF subfamily)